LTRIASIDREFRWDRAAVIAREWRFLDPVRSLCEARGLAYELAREQGVNRRQVREVQDFLTFLEQGPRMASIADARAWAASHPPNGWWTLIVEGLDAALEEHGTDAILQGDLIDAVYDWTRSSRIRREGLSLLTAHRAKGLEFDHVVVLDGGWAGHGRGEDPDASRRLFYVAMTRARRTLALMDMSIGNPILRDLGNDQCLLRRRADIDPADVLACGRLYRRLEMADVNLGYAGRLHEESTTARAIAELRTGDWLCVDPGEDAWLLFDARGRKVGKLAKQWKPDPGTVPVEARVYAILRRSADDDGGTHIKRQRWETVIPEIVLRRERQAVSAGANGPIDDVVVGLG
jgi:ATP-dependent DNA helicase RecQ